MAAAHQNQQDIRTNPVIPDHLERFNNTLNSRLQNSDQATKQSAIHDCGDGSGLEKALKSSNRMVTQLKNGLIADYYLAGASVPAPKTNKRNKAEISPEEELASDISNYNKCKDTNEEGTSDYLALLTNKIFENASKLKVVTKAKTISEVIAACNNLLPKPDESSVNIEAKPTIPVHVINSVCSNPNQAYSILWSQKIIEPVLTVNTEEGINTLADLIRYRDSLQGLHEEIQSSSATVEQEINNINNHLRNDNGLIEYIARVTNSQEENVKGFDTEGIVAHARSFIISSAAYHLTKTFTPAPKAVKSHSSIKENIDSKKKFYHDIAACKNDFELLKLLNSDAVDKQTADQINRNLLLCPLSIGNGSRGKRNDQIISAQHTRNTLTRVQFKLAQARVDVLTDYLTKIDEKLSLISHKLTTLNGKKAAAEKKGDANKSSKYQNRIEPLEQLEQLIRENAALLNDELSQVDNNHVKKFEPITLHDDNIARENKLVNNAYHANKAEASTKDVLIKAKAMVQQQLQFANKLDTVYQNEAKTHWKITNSFASAFRTALDNLRDFGNRTIKPMFGKTFDKSSCGLVNPLRDHALRLFSFSNDGANTASSQANESVHSSTADGTATVQLSDDGLLVDEETQGTAPNQLSK